MGTYHCMSSCNKCGGPNEVKPTDVLDGHTICEADTVCSDCGFKDSWAYGFFMSGSYMESKCGTYGTDVSDLKIPKLKDELDLITEAI